tara:strand:- start:1522 stop:1779 length:258 start_codon:yes stop_codon:yes gene_type:complete
MANVGWNNDKRRDNHGQHQKAVIPDWELPSIYNQHRLGKSYRELAKVYGVSHITIKRKLDKALKWMDEGTFEIRTQPPQSFHNLR